MDEIILTGGDFYITQEENTVFQVTGGTVLVYLVPCKQGKAGKRLFLCEVGEGGYLPSFAVCNERQGEWGFGFAASESAILKKGIQGNWEQAIRDLAQAMGMKDCSPEGFAERIIEHYDLDRVKEEGYLYAVSREKTRTREQSLSLIAGMFDKRRARQRNNMELTGNATYDAAACLCDAMKIEIAPFEAVRQGSRRRPTIRDIARISHFAERSILLEEDWYKKDGGSLLAYEKGSGRPLACLVGKHGKYVAYDPVKDSYKAVDEKLAKTLEGEAKMFYRPFPLKRMDWKDLLKFGFESSRKADFVNMALMGLLGTLIGLLLPALNQIMYDKLIPLSDRKGLVSLGCIMAACLIGSLGFSIVKNLASFRSMRSMQYAVQCAAFDRLFHLPEAFYRQYESGDLADRVYGISLIFQMCARVVTQAGVTAVFSILYLVSMLHYSPMLTLPAFSMVLIAMVVIGYIGFLQTKYENEKMEVDGKLSSMIYQFISGVSQIRLSGAEDRALFRYLKGYRHLRTLDMQTEKMKIMADTLIIVANVVFSVVVYAMAAGTDKALGVGSFMGFITAFGAFSGAMIEVVASVLSVNSIVPAYKRARPILETLPEYEKQKLLPGNITGDIEVSNVSFSYDADLEMVLKQVSFHIKQGEYVGIVGVSGCGKSTLLKLLLGFERPSAGKVFYDGKDIDSLDKGELRRKFGVVLQDGDLIAGSIYENITIASPGATQERVMQVAKAVGLSDDIKQMPMGIHTVLSEDSGMISGGQKQRILIARAIINNPSVLFLDEATSALDNITQAMVCDSLEELKITRVVIAHRLTTVMKCDRILVMDEGRILEEGDFKALMEKKGLFYRMASRQMA